MSPQPPFGESIEMYLKTIAELAVGREPVPVTGVAERLGISTVSASEMIHRLQDRRLVEHTPYKGVHLTGEGTRRANTVIRRHRLWERFLADELRIPWERVHEPSCRLEHATDSELTEALAAYLGAPTTCPHGNPIPSAEGEVVRLEGVPLADLSPGERGTILCIHPESELLLEHLARHGIYPQARIEVEEVAPFSGPLSIRIDGEVHALGREIATHILVDVSEGNAGEKDGR